MKVQSYTKYFSFILPICTICFLLVACSKLGERYGLDRVDEGSSSDSEDDNEDYDYDKPPFLWTQELFEAISIIDTPNVFDIDIRKIFELLRALDVDSENKWVDKITSFAPKDMSTCLHIAAAIKNPKAVPIMKLLLDKMKPLLLNKAGREGLLCGKSKIKDFLEDSVFWNEDMMENTLEWLEEQGYNNNSVLLCTNDARETPLLIAAKRGSIEMFKLLLAYTHKCVGLNHTAHIDMDEKDVLDIVLQQTNDDKLDCLMRELCACSLYSSSVTCIMGESCTCSFYPSPMISPCTHFLGMARCQSEVLVRTMLSNKKKLVYLFKVVHNNMFRRIELLLNTMVTVLPPADCIKVFIKEYPYAPSGYTLFRTALDKNFLKEADKDTLEILTEFFLFILENKSPYSDSITQKLMDLLLKGEPNALQGVLSLMDLAKENNCESALFDLNIALRIIIQLELDTPPGQFWSLLPCLLKRGGCKRKQEDKRETLYTKRRRRAS